MLNDSNINSLLQKMAAYTDKYNLPVVETGNGGDTAHSFGVLYSCLALLQTDTSPSYNATVGNLRPIEYPQGFFVRNPNPADKAASSYRTFSRDQSVSLQCSLVLWNRSDLLWQIVRARYQYNHLMHFNDMEGDLILTKTPDVPSPNEFALWIRGLKCWYLYPLLYVFDAALILDVLIFRKYNLWDADVKTLSQLAASEHRYPTLFSKLAKYLFKRTDAVKHMRNYYDNSNPGQSIRPLADICEMAFYKL